MSDWQPIETAPRDGTEIDVWTADGFRYIACRWVATPSRPEGGWYNPELDHGCGDWFEEDEQPTHWMPLPKEPSNVPY